MSRIKILFVDDAFRNSKNVESYILQFENTNFDVEYLDNFLEAESKIQSFFYDIIILDWLNEKNEPKGDEVLNFLKKSAYSPCIIYSVVDNIDKEIFDDPQFYKLKKVEVNTDCKEIINLVKEITNSAIYKLKKRFEKDLILNLRTFWKYYFQNWEDIKEYLKDQKKAQTLILNQLNDYLMKYRKIINYTLNDEDNILGLPENFIIFPVTDKLEYRMGTILKHRLKNEICILLTPNCSLVNRPKEKIKVYNQLLRRNEESKKNEEIKQEEYSHESNRLNSLLKKEEKKMETPFNPLVQVAKAFQLKNLMEDKYGSEWQTTYSSQEGDLLKSYTKDYFVIIPRTVVNDYLIVKLNDIFTIELESLKEEYVSIAYLRSDFSLELITKFTRYFHRFGMEEILDDYRKK